MSHTIHRLVIGSLLLVIFGLAAASRQSPGSPSSGQPGLMEGRRIGWQTSGGASVAGASAGAYDHGLAADNGDECRLALEEWRRAVRADGKGWRADNPGTGLSATFDRRGMEVRPEGDDWRWGLELLSYGVGGEQRSVGKRSPQVRAAGQQVSYNWDANLEEWYRNDEKGLEHGYTVRQRPGSKGTGALSLRLRTTGGLRVAGLASGRELLFANETGSGVLRYSDLKVFDADGDELNAWFELEEEGGFRVLVEDAGANYPLTIDPLISRAGAPAANRAGMPMASPAAAPQSATKLSIATPPVTGQSGAVLTTQPVIEIQNSSSAVVTSSSAPVTVAVLGADGVLSGTVTVNAVAGVATFTNLSLAGKVGTSYSLVFSSTGLTSATQASLTVTAGPAAKLAITTQPVAGASGAVMAPQPVVEIRDAQDNLTASTATVTVQVEAGPAAAVLGGGTTSPAAVAGVATFSGLTFAGAVGTNYRLRFTSGSLTPVVSNNVSVTGVGAAAQLVVTTQPLGAPSGAQLTTQPVISVRDTGGNTVTGSSAPVTASVSPGGSLAGTTTVNASSGISTFTNLALSGMVGTNYTLTFASPGLTSATSNTVTVTVGAGAQLAITTQPVGGASGALLQTQPVVEVRDSGGNLVTTSGAAVQATITPSSGTLSGITTISASAGVARFTNLTLAGVVGTNYTIKFTSTGLTEIVSSTLTVTVGAPSQVVLTIQPAGSVASGVALTTQPVARIQDAQGNTVTTSTAAVTATVVSPTTGSLGGTTTVNAVAGVATFSGLTISGLDGTPLTLRFSSLGLISADAAAPVFVSGVGAASRLGIRTQPVAGNSGAALATQPVVEVRDSGGNVVTGSTASVTVAIQGAGGSLTTGPTTVSAAAGIATFANLVLNGTVGVPYTLRFSSTGLTEATSSTLFVNGVGLPTQLVILTQPVAGASGSLLTTQPVVAIRDAGNNTVTTASATVSVAIALGSGGSIGGAQTVTTAGGVATFSNISFTGSTATDYVLQFAASGYTSANSNIIRLTGSGAASQLDITTQPVAGLSGATLTTQPVVVVRDAGGNRVMSSTAPITISVFSGTGGALSGTQTINAISGEATFSNLSLIGKQGTNYVLRFSSPGLTPVNSGNVTVTGAGVATQLAITTQPVGGASGAALATQPIVEVRDSGGNIVNSTASVTVTIQSGANGTLGGTQTVAAVAGVVNTFSLTLAGRVNTNYALQFSSPGLLSAISNSVVVTSGAATQLAIITQPVGGASGTALTVQPVVEVRDALGNRVTGSTVTVTASIFSGAGGVLSGTTALNAVDGRVTFTDLVLTGLAGTDYILQFASSTLVFPTSNPVVLSAGAASQITVTTQPVGGPSGALLAVQPRVEIRDAQGNRVTNSSVAVSVSISSGVGGTLGGTTTVNTAAGIATFTNLTLAGPTTSTFVLQFSATGLTPAPSSNVTVTPGTAARLVVVTQPIGGASGAVLATQPVVHVRDAQNNTVLTSNAPVTASIFSGAGTLGGTVTVNAVAGVATFGNLTLAGQVSSTYVLRFTSGSLTLIDSNSLNLSGPGVATQLVLTTQPVAGISGAAFTTQPRLEIRDSGGNVVTSSTDEVKATILTGTGGVLSGGATVNASGGFVSFSNLSLAGLVGTSYIIQFSSSGMASVSSNSVSVAGPGAAALLAIVSQPVGGSSGGPLATQPVIAVRDTGGNTITSSGVQVSVAISSGSGGTLTGTTSINASAGMAMFSGLTFAGTVGVNYKFTFSAPGLVAVTSNDVTVSAGSPGELVVTTQPVGGLSGGQLTTMPVVVIRDAQGNATNSSAQVTATIVTGAGGVLGGTTTVNAFNGTATFSGLTLAGTVGTNYVLRFTSTGNLSIDSTIVTVSPGVPSRLALIAQPVGGISGQQLTTQPIVEIRDSQGNKVTSSTMPVVASIQVGGGGALGGTTTVSAVDGVATFSNLTLAGTIGTSYVLRFATGTITPVSSSGVGVTGAGSPAQLVMTTQPVGGASGATLLTQPVITIRDSGGNTVTTSSASVAVELFSGAGGALTGTKTVNAINGVVSFSGLVMTGTVNTNYVLQFASPGLPEVNSNTVRVTPGAPDRLMVMTQPAGGASGLVLATQPVIGIGDAQNNLVTTSSAAVTVSIQSGGGTLGGTQTVTAINGVATFASVTLSGNVGTVYVLSFASGTLTPTNSNNVTLTPGAPTQLVIATAPVGSGSGAPLTTQPVIQIQDAQGNVTNSTATVSVAIQSGAGGVLSGTLSVGAINGVATFNNLSLSGSIGTNYLLRFTSGALAGVTSGFVTVSVGAATQLVVATQPVAGISGALMTTRPVVEVRDSGNNLVTTAAPQVTVEIASGSGGLLGGSTTVAAANGIADFTGLTFAGTVGANYVLRFSSTGATFAALTGSTATATSNSVSVSGVGSAARLAVLTQPTGGPSGAALARQPVVVIQDSGGNTVTNASTTVTVALVSGTGLAGTLSVPTTGGTAAFTNLALTGTVATNFVLRFTAPGLTDADSNVVNVMPGAATNLAIVTPPTGGASGSLMSPAPVIAIRDAQGNTVTSSIATVSVAILSGADGTLSGTTAVSAVNGLATFSNLRLAGKINTNYVLSFSSGTLVAVNSGNLIVTPGPAAQLVISAQPVAGVSATPLTTQPQVLIRDAQGNLVDNSTAAVTVSLPGAGGLITGTTTINAASGIATFTDLTFAGLLATNYTFRFASGTLTPVDSQPVAVTGVGAASQLVITTQPVGAASGAALSTPPIVAIRDSGGNTLTGVTAPVTVEIHTGTGGQLGGVTTVNALNGAASFNGLTLAGLVTSQYVLRFSSPGLAPVNSSNVTVTPGAATQLGLSTQPVGGTSGAVLTTSPVVVVRDAQGNTVTNSSLAITAAIQSGSGGSLTGTSTVTAVNGIASFSNLILSGLTTSSYVLRFTAGALTLVDSNPVTITSGVATQLWVTTQPAGAASGSLLGIQPVVEVRDSAGNRVASTAPITVAVFSGAGGTLGGTATVNAVNGTATFYDLTLAGRIGVSYILRFSSGSLTAADSGSVAITTAGSPVRLAITAQPVGGASGAALSVQPQIAVQDSGGNTITTASATVQATILSGAGGTLGGTTSVNVAGGVANFAGLTLAGTAGTNYVLRFAATGLASADSSNVVVTAGSATQLGLIVQPVGGPSGAALATPPIVVVRDAQGNTVTTSTAVVTVVLTSGAGGTLGGTMTSNAAGGVASFNGLTASGLVGNNYMLQFTSPGLSSVNSNSFTLTPGAATRLVITTQPTGGASGAALSVQPVVAIRDAQGNAVTSPPMAVTASLQSGSGGTLGGISTVNSVNGLATFTGLTLAGATGSNYVLRFSAEGLTPADSGNVTVTAGTATQLMITSQPVGGGSGAALATQPVVAIRDAQGNPVASSNIPVTVTVQSGTGGVLGGPTTVNAQNGVATFSGLTLTGLVGTNYVLRFAATGLTAVDSTNVTVTAGAATQLTITTQPVGGASGAVLTTQPVVTIRDAQGNTVTNSTIPVGVTIQQGTGGTLGGGTSVNAVGGVATYTGLTLAGTAGASYVLRFTAAGLPSADSAPVTVVAGSPALLAIATQPVGGPSGQSLSVQPVISIRDAQGNPVTTSTAVVTVGLQSGLGGSIGGTTTVAAVNGVATFSNLTLAGTVGTSYVLRFTSTGLTLVDSASVTVTVGAPTHLAVATQPAGSASGAPFSTQPVIVVRDAQGNTVTTSTAVITAAIGSGSGGSLGGTLSVAAQGGLAAFSDLSLAGTVGGVYSLRFTSAGLIPVDSNNLTLTTGSGSQMILTTQPVGGASGAVLAVSPVVAIRDSFGNTVTSATTAVTASLVPGTTGNLTGTTTVNAVNGVATFSNLSLSGLVGTTYSIRFTASNLATVQSANITVTPGAATQLTISTQPLGGASGGLLATQPAVSIRDAQGNLVTSPTVAVTVSLVPGAGGNLLGGTTVNSINGVATFNNLNLSGTVGASYVLRFTAPGLTSTDAAGITVTAGAATQLGVSTQPVAGASGAVFTTPPAITIRDAQGNTVTTSTAAVTVQVTGAGGTLGGATTVNAVGGVATFANLTLTGSTGVNYVLQFSSSGLTSVSSSNVTVVGAGTPTQLAFQAGNNQIATAGALLSTSPGVIVRDGNNNPVQGVTVTFAVASGGGTITGSTPTTGSNGVATVGSWTLGTTAGANTLTATITGLAPVTFTATGVAGPASQLAINAGNNQTALVGAAVAILPSVVVRDANSNPVSGVTVTFSVGAGGGSITGATATSNSSGIASVGSWTLGAVAGTNTLVATSQGLAPVTFTATTGTPPSINAVAGITRAAGTSSSNLTIAYVSDSETPAGNLTVTVTNTIPSTGVAISNIVNTNGTITATVNVDCAVAASTATISLRVSDGSANATTTLTINISANTPPSLGYGAPGQTTPMVSLNAGLSTVITPSTPPADNVSVSSIAVQSVGGFTGAVSVNTAGIVSISNAGPVGIHTITIRATDNCGVSTDAIIRIEVTNVSVSSPMVASGDSVIGPGSTLTLRQTLTNSTQSSGTVTFVATLPPAVTPINCTSDLEGACVITSTPPLSSGVNTNGVRRRFLLDSNQTTQQITWTGTIPANRSVTVSYVVQVAANSAGGQYQITTSVNGTAGPTSTITVSAPQSGPGDAPAAVSLPNQQKPSSVLIFNLYSSSINSATSDTSISLTNTNSVSPVMVHLFFVDGANGTVKDQFISLTQNQTSTFLASDIDPEVTGYIIAVAVDSNGCPTIKNNLIGRADVWLPTGHYATLPAVGISGIMASPQACNASSTTATIAFNGIQYDELPRTLAIDSLPSPANGSSTMLFANRIGGDLSGAALKIGPLSGLLYDDSEISRTFSISPGAAQMRGTLNDNLPRTQPRYSSVIPAGRTGWMKFWATGDEALSGAMINKGVNGFSGGYNLQTLTTTSTASLTIPVIPVN